MDKDFSRWDEIKIYMRCFCAQLVGRSSSFNSISAAGDGHPESGLSNGAVSWQNPPTHTHTHTHARKCSDTLEKKKPVPLAHLELDATAEGELWMLAGGQITGREKIWGGEKEWECENESDPPRLLLVLIIIIIYLLVYLLIFFKTWVCIFLSRKKNIRKKQKQHIHISVFSHISGLPTHHPPLPLFRSYLRVEIGP